MITETVKQYVGVIVQFETDGTMLPRYVRWIDDELYKIDSVKQIRSACESKTGGLVDRYTIKINGKESYLYFEHNPDDLHPNVGKWYVELKDYEL